MGQVVRGHCRGRLGRRARHRRAPRRLAIYLGSLGPAGHDIRLATADVVGWGRLPRAACWRSPWGCASSSGRAGDRRGSGTVTTSAPATEAARAVIGASLGVLVIAGLAGLAGGSPSWRAPTAELGSAGGWVGAVVADPSDMPSAGLGAALVLLAVAVVALVVFTGISVRTAGQQAWPE